MPELQLPSYREQSPEVAERFRKLHSRRVKMEIRGLSKMFETSKGPITALKEIDFSIHHREFVTVIGPSGCGKSTLIRMLAGLDFPTGGEALLEGKRVTGPGSDRGMVFQGYTLFPWRTVKKNVMFGLEMSGRSGTAVESEARSWINIVGLGGFEDSYPCQLSGGMKQRVAIARALANRPGILFMDEPFGALDAQTRGQMQAYLLRIWKNVDVTIMFVTHDLDEAVYLSDRILVLKANPGEVSEVIEVPVPRPRNPDQFISAEFLATKKRLEELIHPKGMAGRDDLPVARMVGDGDEVE